MSTGFILSIFDIVVSFLDIKSVLLCMERVVNSNTRKFHYPSCGSVNKMKESNKLYYIDTRDDLISQGYNPYKYCHP